MAEPNSHGDTHLQIERLKRHLYQIFWEWVQRHAAKLVSGFAGLLIGIVTAYIAIWTQLHEAHSAAVEAKSASDRLNVSITQFATRDQVEAVKEKVDDLWAWREAVYDKDEQLTPHPKAGARKK